MKLNIRSPEWVKRVFRHWSLWVLLAIALGVVSGNFVFDTFIGKPNVGIVQINSLLYPWTLPRIAEMLKYVAENDKIKAVVLEIDSPGGDAVSSEEIYLEILELRKKKPVIAHINLVGASGAYYVSLAANLIYAKSTTTLGSIGAWVQLPEHETMPEDVIWTGPYKETGSSIRETVNRLEMFKQNFLQTVTSQRGDKLKISQDELSKAGIYNGIESLRYGLIDEFGSSSQAIQKAAELAGLRNYGTVDVNTELDVYLPAWWTFSWSAEASKIHSNMLPIYYYLYTSPEAQE